jgi:hypothetical protein
MPLDHPLLGELSIEYGFKTVKKVSVEPLPVVNETI